MRERGHFLPGNRLSPTLLTSSAFPRFSDLMVTKSGQRTGFFKAEQEGTRCSGALQGIGFQGQVQSPEPSGEESSPGPTPLSTLLAHRALPSYRRATLPHLRALPVLVPGWNAIPRTAHQPESTPFSAQRLPPREPWHSPQLPQHPYIRWSLHLCIPSPWHNTWYPAGVL